MAVSDDLLAHAAPLRRGRIALTCDYIRTVPEPHCPVPAAAQIRDMFWASRLRLPVDRSYGDPLMRRAGVELVTVIVHVIYIRGAEDMDRNYMRSCRHSRRP